MKEMIIKSMSSVRKRIDQNKRKFCFELFGYDFILDEDFNTWLIEINTNPCIEESSELLKMLLPRMIEDMMKLTIDVVFPKNRLKKRQNKEPMSPNKNQPKQGNNASMLDKIEEESIEN